MIMLLLLLFVGCSQKVDFLEKKEPYIRRASNPVFNPYILQFRRNMKVQKGIAVVITTPIFFGKLKTPNVGMCYYYGNFKNTEIAIDRKYWITLTELQKQTLIDHELGHCVLKRKHNDKETDCPESVMRSYTFSEDEIQRCYVPRNGEYQKELFRQTEEKL